MKDIVKFLQERLQTTLPGDAAHQRMLAKQLGPNFRLKHEGSPRKGAVMIMLYQQENGEICFPLTQRHNYVGVHGGQISLPGGKRDESDASLIETAIRETHEEIGVRIQGHQIIGSLSDLHITASNFVVKPIISFIEKTPDFVADPYEVAHIFSTNIDQLLATDTLKETELTVGPEVRLKAPYFDIDGKIVWGATAMILSEFMTILKEYKK
ncbi:CoA pyrophosphatase [Marivirga sp. S37H4]|uniref:CoA pyrophosphatase n=1 Tax=Marivirga aurantiaca TaxID=2802615 RepID=A0A935C7R4_9BACT|nr:CoA pyrophosphatase [Marivirga aurantiaca]MBK6265059.1 CoA pyrophosphatase [Marivirga aurantiaca]